MVEAVGSVVAEAVIGVVRGGVGVQQQTVVMEETDGAPGRGGYQQSYGPPASVLGETMMLMSLQDP